MSSKTPETKSGIRHIFYFSHLILRLVLRFLRLIVRLVAIVSIPFLLIPVIYRYLSTDSITKVAKRCFDAELFSGVRNWVLNSSWLSQAVDTLDRAFHSVSDITQIPANGNWFPNDSWSKYTFLLTGLVTLSIYGDWAKKEIRTSILEIWRRVKQIFRIVGGISVPPVTSKKSLRHTGQSIKGLPSYSWLMLKSSWKLTVALVIVVLISLPISQSEKNINNNLDQIISHIGDLKVDIDALKKTTDRIYQRLDECVTGTQRETVFFLAHNSNGNLETSEGICPGILAENNEYLGEDVNFEWLRNFKRAILACSEKCSKEGLRVRLEVRGFASIAPIIADGSDATSDALNCEIANRRAEAVVGYLISKSDSDWPNQCKRIVGGSDWKKGESGPCEGRKEIITYGEDQGLDFDLIYRPWQCYESMTQSRPVYDGSRLCRIYAAEFLNRTVEIVVMNNACWREQWLYLERSAGCKNRG